MSMDSKPIVTEQIYHAPIEVVWKAITDKDQMRQWFFEPMTEFEPEPGFETQFIVKVEDQVYLHLLKLIDVVPLKRIVYDWRYGGYPGISTVAWDLSETAKGTKLVLTHEGIETFPQDNPVFSRESGQGGWDYFIRDSLKRFLQRHSP